MKLSFLLVPIVVLAMGTSACSQSQPASGGGDDSDVGDGTGTPNWERSPGLADASLPDNPADVGERAPTPDAGLDGAGPSDASADAGGPPRCVPTCGSAECGANGCGGLCGVCDANAFCHEGDCLADATFASCGGLVLKKAWSGRVTGTLTNGVVGRVPIQSPVEGELSFSLACVGNQFSMTGAVEVSGGTNPLEFSLAVAGTVNPTNNGVQSTWSGGETLAFAGLIQYLFSLNAVGVVTTEATMSGSWEVGSYDVVVQNGGLYTEDDVLPLQGQGTWEVAAE